MPKVRRPWRPAAKRWSHASPELQWAALLTAWRAATEGTARAHLLRLMPVEAEPGCSAPYWRSKAGAEKAQVDAGVQRLASLLAGCKSAEDAAAVWIAATATLTEAHRPDAAPNMLPWLLFNIAERVPGIERWTLPFPRRSPFPMAVPEFPMANPLVPAGPLNDPAVLVYCAAANAAATIEAFNLAAP